MNMTSLFFYYRTCHSPPMSPLSCAFTSSESQCLPAPLPQKLFSTVLRPEIWLSSKLHASRSPTWSSLVLVFSPRSLLMYLILACPSPKLCPHRTKGKPYQSPPLVTNLSISTHPHSYKDQLNIWSLSVFIEPPTVMDGLLLGIQRILHSVSPTLYSIGRIDSYIPPSHVNTLCINIQPDGFDFNPTEISAWKYRIKEGWRSKSWAKSQRTLRYAGNERGNQRRAQDIMTYYFVIGILKTPLNYNTSSIQSGK